MSTGVTSKEPYPAISKDGDVPPLPLHFPDTRDDRDAAKEDVSAPSRPKKKLKKRKAASNRKKATIGDTTTKSLVGPPLTEKKKRRSPYQILLEDNWDRELACRSKRTRLA